MVMADALGLLVYSHIIILPCVGLDVDTYALGTDVQLPTTVSTKHYPM